MSNPYYSNTGYPQFRAPGKSEDMRAELKRVEAGLDRLPDPIMPNQPVFGNASGTGMVMKDKAAAKALLGLDKVDNTADADKPISSATAAEFASTQADLATKADAAETTAALETKADITYVDAELATKADAATLFSDLGISNFIKTLLDDVDASTAQTTLGISNFIKTLLDDVDASAARGTLGITEGAAWIKIGSFIIQCGTVVVPSSGVLLVNYPLSYVFSNPIVVVCNGDHQANANGKLNISSNSNKSELEIIRYDNIDPCRANWIAIGR